MSNISAYAAKSATSPLTPIKIERREVGENDVQIKILYCGVCHTDIHFARNEWGMSLFPVVPGHEIIGRVTKTGAKVDSFKEGDLVGVGCMVDSCRNCNACQDNLEQYCEESFTGTYSFEDKKHGGITFGGYSKQIIVDKDFVLHIPKNLDTKAVGPLLCAGITTWSPLKQWNVKEGDTVGIVGLGGLGHMGVKFAHALGAKVVMITTSPEKGKDAKSLGADEVLISTDAQAMTDAAKSFDFILNTIPVSHDINPYVNLLKRDATMVLLGVIEPLAPELNAAEIIFKRCRIAGSLIGGIKETQEMLDFCGENNIVPEIEMINIQEINEAYARMLKSDVKYRFVIDMASLE